MSQGVYVKIRHNMIASIMLRDTKKEFGEWYCNGFLFPANFRSSSRTRCPHHEGEKIGKLKMWDKPCEH